MSPGSVWPLSSFFFFCGEDDLFRIPFFSLSLRHVKPSFLSFAPPGPKLAKCLLLLQPDVTALFMLQALLLSTYYARGKMIARDGDDAMRREKRKGESRRALASARRGEIFISDPKPAGGRGGWRRKKEGPLARCCCRRTEMKISPRSELGSARLQSP